VTFHGRNSSTSGQGENRGRAIGVEGHGKDVGSCEDVKFMEGGIFEKEKVGGQKGREKND